jgi:hypothetical protein
LGVLFLDAKRGEEVTGVGLPLVLERNGLTCSFAGVKAIDKLK